MRNKKISLIAIISVLALTLSGCVRQDKNGNPYGMTYEYLAKPTQHLMEWIANFFGGPYSYGWAIIIITFVVRMILLPIMISQMRKSTIQQEKMGMVGPEMRDIQERQKTATTPEEKAAISQEMMALYKDNGISMTGGIGCLPLLIQMPVFAALYAAIRYSHLSNAMFYGIKLGSPSIILAILSFVAYLIQGYLSTLGIPEAQKKQMRMMMFVSPIMLGYMAMISSAGLGLYFFIGGIFAIIQTIIINLYRPKIKRDIEAELKKNTPKKKKVVKPIIESPTKIAPKNNQPAKKQNRNAGKQQHHK